MSTPRSQREPRGPACGKPIVGWGFGRFEGSAAHDVDAARVTESRHVSGRPDTDPRQTRRTGLAEGAICAALVRRCRMSRPLRRPPGRRSCAAASAIKPQHSPGNDEALPRRRFAASSGRRDRNGRPADLGEPKRMAAEQRLAPTRPARGSSAPGRCVRTAGPMRTHQGRG